MKRQPLWGRGTAGGADAGVAAIGEEDRGPVLKQRIRRGDLSAVAEVRRALRGLLRQRGALGRCDVAELLTSELVTNALVHTDRGAVVLATLTGGEPGRHGARLRVEVRDFAARHPTLRAEPPRAEGTSGRGLLLVHALADAWGVRTHAVGKAVWFELDAPPE